MIGVAIYRSPSLAACEERALVLRAVGIGSELDHAGDEYVLYVALDHEVEARRQLQAFALENVRPAVRPRPVLHGRAWTGLAGYVSVLIFVAWLASIDAGGRSWFEAGRFEAGLVRAGELWRTVTALTLHLDVAHLLSNLGFGSLFGFFCGQLLGPGVAWAVILTGGVLGNLASAIVQAPDHRAVGASTAVFAALGLLAISSLRLHMTAGQSWAYRWGPLIAAVALLGFTGTGGERTDVTAHVTGFLAGGVLGLAASRIDARYLHSARIQQVAGLLTILVVVLAWFAALAAKAA